MGLEFHDWMFIRDDSSGAELTYIVERWIFWWISPIKSTAKRRQWSLVKDG